MPSAPFSKRLRVAVILMAISPGGFAAKLPTDVKRLLQSIPSATGQNIFDRIHSCGITYSTGSYAEVAVTDFPDIGAVRGDIIVQALINLPRLPGDSDPIPYTDLTATWVIHAGIAQPESGWAKKIQFQNRPLGSGTWLNC